MSDNKAKALKDDIKVEVVVNDCLNGNDAATIDITNLLNFDNAAIVGPDNTLAFGGVVGYMETHYDENGDTSKVITQPLFSEYELDCLGKKVARILQASIVNAKQLEALNGMLTDIFYQMKKDKAQHINWITSKKLD